VFGRAELAMLQMCQHVALSLAHALVQGRGACSPPRCGVSNNKPLQEQYLLMPRRCLVAGPAPGKVAEPKHSPQAAPAPPVPLPAVQKWLILALASPAAAAGHAPTHTGHQAPASTSPPLRTDPSCPASAMQRRRTRTRRGRGEHLHSL